MPNELGRLLREWKAVYEQRIGRAISDAEWQRETTLDRRTFAKYFYPPCSAEMSDKTLRKLVQFFAKELNHQTLKIPAQQWARTKKTNKFTLKKARAEELLRVARAASSKTRIPPKLTDKGAWDGEHDELLAGGDARQLLDQVLNKLSGGELELWPCTVGGQAGIYGWHTTSREGYLFASRRGLLCRCADGAKASGSAVLLCKLDAPLVETLRDRFSDADSKGDGLVVIDQVLSDAGSATDSGDGPLPLRQCYTARLPTDEYGVVRVAGETIEVCGGGPMPLAGFKGQLRQGATGYFITSSRGGDTTCYHVTAGQEVLDQLAACERADICFLRPAESCDCEPPHTTEPRWRQRVRSLLEQGERAQPLVDYWQQACKALPPPGEVKLRAPARGSLRLDTIVVDTAEGTLQEVIRLAGEAAPLGGEAAADPALADHCALELSCWLDLATARQGQHPKGEAAPGVAALALQFLELTAWTSLHELEIADLGPQQWPQHLAAILRVRQRAYELYQQHQQQASWWQDYHRVLRCELLTRLALQEEQAPEGNSAALAVTLLALLDRCAAGQDGSMWKTLAQQAGALAGVEREDCADKLQQVICRASQLHLEADGRPEHLSADRLLPRVKGFVLLRDYLLGGEKALEQQLDAHSRAELRGHGEEDQGSALTLDLARLRCRLVFAAMPQDHRDSLRVGRLSWCSDQERPSHYAPVVAIKRGAKIQVLAEPATLPRGERKPLDELLDGLHHVAVLGVAGGGKSWGVARYVDRCYHELASRKGRCWIPVFQSVKEEVRQGRHSSVGLGGKPAALLISALARQPALAWLSADPDLAQALAGAGALMLVFDGLNEIPVAQRPGFLTALNALKQRYPRCRLLVVSRKLHWDQASFEKLIQLSTLEVLPLTNRDVHNFVTLYLLDRFKDTWPAGLLLKIFDIPSPDAR